MILRHPTRETILDFERLQGRSRRRVGDHLARCAACRSRLARLRALREAAAEATAAEPRDDLWAAIEARLDGGAAVILPVPGPVGGRARGLPRAAVVALVALLACAGLAAAAVGLTPLGRFLGRDGAATDQVVPPATPLPVAALEVEVPPAGLSVALPDAADGFRLRVVLRDERLLAMVPSPETGGLAFRSGSARVEVTGAAEGLLELRVPVDGPAVRITARGATLAVVRHGRVRALGREDGAALDATVGELIRAAGKGGR